MGWIARKIQKMLEKEHQNEAKLANCEVRSTTADLGEGMRITVYNASGGKIIRFYKYDNRKDRGYDTTYVIHDNADLATSLSELITIENLKQ